MTQIDPKQVRGLAEFMEEGADSDMEPISTAQIQALFNQNGEEVANE